MILFYTWIVNRILKGQETMLITKHRDHIAGRLMAAALAVGLLFAGAAPAAEASGNAGETMEYETKLFDTSAPITIDVVMDADEWQNMLDSAADKEWQSCDVTVNGTRFDNVGIRTKGDSSLESIAMDSDSDRYSFKLNFGKYNKGQTCWGLDKLNLNNNYGDATNMKEALIYDMFHFLGADAPLYNYAAIYVNGEYWGVYLAIEAVDDSFLSRNYGEDSGELYKPGEDEADDFDEDEGSELEWELMEMLSMLDPEEELDPALTELLTEVFGENWSDEMWSGEDGSDEMWYEESWDMGGADLNYVGDDPDSYWSIWNCEVTKTDDGDHLRVVEALKNISAGENLETYLDVDNILKYMAVHNFSVNNDSLSGDGPHNYYLYEQDGRLNIIPWDYNLSFGAYVIELGGDIDDAKLASDMINSPIDDSWAMTSFFDCILQNGEYLAKYHEYYQKLIDEYVLGGGFQAFYERTRAQIDELVKTDPHALYSYEEYEAAAEMLAQAAALRGRSVKGQLDGTIPSTSEGQAADADALIDASAIDLAVMGGDDAGGDFDEDDWLAYILELAEQWKDER